jgi:hypothetical protein
MAVMALLYLSGRGEAEQVVAPLSRFLNCAIQGRTGFAPSRRSDLLYGFECQELRALRRLLRETPEGRRATYLFVSERMAPLSVAGYQRMVARVGQAAS